MPLPDLLAAHSIPSLELRPQLEQLKDGSLGPAWSQEQCDKVHREYVRFLLLKVKHADQQIVPSWSIDMLWHLHILDTQRYAEACAALLGAPGAFIHHQPGFGHGGPAEELALANAWAATLAGYRMRFEEDAPSDVWDQPFRCAAPGPPEEEEG